MPEILIVKSRTHTVVRQGYCFSLPGLLKWFEIILACVILGLLLWEGVTSYSRYLIEGEEYTCIVCVACLIINLILLLVFFMSWHVQYNCFTLVSIYYGLSVLMWLAAAGVEVYVTVYFRDRRGVLHTYTDDSLYARRAAAAALCFANALLFIASLHQAKFYDL